MIGYSYNYTMFCRQLGCLAFSLTFWPKIKQLLSNCPASDWSFSLATRSDERSSCLIFLRRIFVVGAYLFLRKFRADLFLRTFHKSSKFGFNFRAISGKFFAKTILSTPGSVQPVDRHAKQTFQCLVTTSQMVDVSAT